MRWTLLVRSTFLTAGHDLDPDIVEELAQHAAAVYQRARAEGATAEAAERHVRDTIHGWAAGAASFTRRPRRRASIAGPPDAPATPWSGMLLDVKYAARLALRRPGAAALPTATIALGVAATTLLFSVVYGVLARPLPWPDSDRLAHLVEMRHGQVSRFGPIVTNGAYLAWQESATTIEGVAAYRPLTFTLTGLGSAERVRAHAVSASLFPLVHAQPLIGRTLEPADEQEGAERVVVLSHGFWTERLGGAPDALGRTLRLDGVAHTVVGVMPPGFAFPDRGARLWTAFHVPPAAGGSLSMFAAIARLRAGVTPAQAAAEATARARTAPDPGLTAMAVFGTAGPPEIAIVPAVEMLSREIRPALLVLMAAVGLLLMAAAGNAAAVQIARASSRQRELAIRAAIGAQPGRLVRQVLAESLLIGVAGAAMGLLLAALLHRSLPAFLPADFPRLEAVSFDWRVALFAVGAAIGSALLAGVLPAVQTRKVDVTSTIAEDGLAPAGGGLRTRSSRLRAALVVAQVAVAAALLVGAGLLARSFMALAAADRGYDPGGVLTATLPMSGTMYEPARRVAILEGITERLDAVPGVTAAAFTSILPLSGSESVRAFTMPARNPADPPVSIQSAFRVVSPAYFQAMGMRLVEGRTLTDGDTFSSRPGVVINQTFARQVFDGSPLGRQIPLGTADDGRVEFEVVGVIRDVWRGTSSVDVQSEMFVSYRQWPAGMTAGEPAIVVRTAGDPAELAPTIRAAVHDQDESLAVASLATMEERVRDGLAQPRLYAVALSAFAAASLVLAAVGLFGALAFSVTQRRREIGVRAALGARPASIVRLVAGQGLALALVGLALGWILALVATRLLASLLFGIDAKDPLTFTLVGMTVIAAAVLACAVPAWRAARLDPLDAMRRT